MARTFILPPTTSESSSAPVTIAPLTWSPDPALCSTTRYNALGQPQPFSYDGAGLAPRAIRVVLVAGQGATLPANARLSAYLKTFDGYNDGETYHPAQYEPLPDYDLTPERQSLSFWTPIEGLEWRKAESEDAYGALAFGFGTAQTAEF